MTVEEQTVRIIILAQDTIQWRAFVPEVFMIQTVLPARWMVGDVVGWLVGYDEHDM
jgi:hypothetical protein